MSWFNQKYVKKNLWKKKTIKRFVIGSSVLVVISWAMLTAPLCGNSIIDPIHFELFVRMNKNVCQKEPTSKHIHISTVLMA